MDDRKPLTVSVKDPSDVTKPGEEKEEDMRKRLCLPIYVTIDDALNSCRRLYSMFNMPLSETVTKFIEDPHCPGGKPRCI